MTRRAQKACRRALPLMLALVVLTTTLAALGVTTSPHASALSANYGDGIAVYAQTSNTKPQFRTYSASGNSFGAAADTATGAAGSTFITRTSPIKQEAMAGYVDSTGTLRLLCYDGTSWTQDWSVSVGGTGTTRRFDIAYETSTGNAMVVYSTDAASTNELAYRTHPGASGCNSGWSSATNLSPASTSGKVQWVKIAWDRRASSNLMTVIWADANADLSAMQWSGSAWGNEPSPALELNLDFVSAAQDVDDFDVEYESLSGDVMVIWGRGATANTNGAYYETCTGGIALCTWGATTAWNGTGDRAEQLDLSANPNTDELVFASIGYDGSTDGDLQTGYWSGTAWTNSANKDTSAISPTAGNHSVSTGWLKSGATTRSIVVYADSTATTTSLSFYNGSTGTFNAGTDFACSPVPGAFRWFDVQMDPRNQDRLMLAYNDANNDLFAKRLVMDSTPTYTWTNSDGSAALEASIQQTTAGDFSFAYWRAPITLTQNNYRWYQNADAVQPTTSLAAENTSIPVNSSSTITRLRQNVGISSSNLAASTTGFKLQYATNTSGTWTDVSDPWCNTASPLCSTSWASRERITMNNSGQSTNLTNFPILVTLNSGNIDYTKTQNSGQDIRFTDSDGTALNYEIEKWNESGNSYVWVKVPQVDALSSTDYFWMYYNNASASDAQSKTNVWDSNTVSMYHMNTDPSTNCATSKQICDSTSNANNGTMTGSMTSGNKVTGQVGDGINFNGTSQYFNVPTSTSQNVTNYTVSAWVKPAALSAYETVMCRWVCLATSGTTVSNSFTYTSGSWDELLIGTVSTGTWYKIDAEFNTTSNLLSTYVNGVFVGSQTATHDPLVTSQGAMIGNSSSNEYWNGVLDELKIDNVDRSADWIKASYMVGANTFNTISSEQTQTAASWKLYNNATPASGAAITSNLLTGSNVSGTYQENAPSALNPATTVGQYIEYDFALDPANATPGATYYFRMVKADGTALSSYTRYPTMYFGPTYNQKDYRWYQNTDAIQPTTAYAAEDTAASLSSSSSIARLRGNMTVGGMNLPAGNASFKLQYGTSTSGPWTDVAAWCSTASPLCNSSWATREKITFNNSASSTNLTNYAVEVALNASNIDYTNTQNSGQDIRFTDPDGTALNYEIEKWDETGTSIVWVKVPQIDAGSLSDYIYMYYNNASASDAQNKTAVWDSSTAAVYHMNTSPASTCSGTKEICDSSTNANHGDMNGSMTSGQLVTGQIGSGYSLDGSNDQFSVPDSNSLDAGTSTSVTLSVWIKPNALSSDDCLFEKENNYNFELFSGNINASLYNSSTGWTGYATSASPAPITVGNWAKIDTVFDTSANTQTTYVNGVQIGTAAQTINPTISAVQADVGSCSGPSGLFNGIMDELRIATTARSADWVKADYLNGSGSFSSYGSAETLPSWIYKNNATPADGATVTSNLLSTSNVAGSYTESNPTANNPNAVNSGQNVEYDFALDPSIAPTGIYFFRIIRGDGTALDTYTNYPSLILQGTNQAAYRWFNNANSTDVGSALAAQDTATTAPTQGTAFRLRSLVDISQFKYDSTSTPLKLQYATRSGTCDIAFSGETYADVASGSGAIRYYDNASPADGATATSNVNDPTYLAHTKVMQSYEEANNTATIATIPTGQLGEWDFSLVDNSAVGGTTYCFRLVYSDGTTLGSYTQIPQITTAVTNQAPNAPTNLAQTKTDTTPIPATTLYNFDAGLQGWISDPVNTNLSLASNGTTTRTGAGSAKLTMSSSLQYAWITDNIWSTRDLSSNGSTFSAWVYLPASNTGTNWQAEIEIYDNNSTGHDGPMTYLTAGKWTLITYTADPSLLSSMTGFSIYAEAQDWNATGTNYLYVDDVQQGTGIWTPETSVRFTASVSDPDSSDTDKLCIEAQPINTSFTNTEQSCGSLVSQGTTANHTLTSLTNGTQYHWQARVKDATGAYSSWVAYGGNSDTTTASPDFGIDSSAPSTGSVKDGAAQGVDVGYNDGSLSSLGGNWTGFSDGSSGIARYDYSIGSSAGGTQILTWTPTSLTAITATGLTLQTGVRYYINVRAVDVAGNTSSVISSDGQYVAPTLTFTLGSSTVSLGNLNAANSYTSSQSVSVTTSTNAYSGYVVRQYATAPLTNGANSIASYAGTYASPTTWTGAGFGYTSNDTAVQSSGNLFSGATKYASLASSGPGDIVADHTANVTGTPISGESFTLTYKVVSSATQAAGAYSTSIRLSATASY